MIKNQQAGYTYTMESLKIGSIQHLLGLSEYMCFVELEREQKETIVVRTDDALVESEMV
jgi:hypothetical protein